VVLVKNVSMYCTVHPEKCVLPASVVCLVSVASAKGNILLQSKQPLASEHLQFPGLLEATHNIVSRALKKFQAKENLINLRCKSRLHLENIDCQRRFTPARANDD